MLFSLTHFGRVLPSPCTVLRNYTDSRPPSLFLGKFRDGGREVKVREGLGFAVVTSGSQLFEFLFCWSFEVLFLEFVFWVRKDLDLGLGRVFGTRKIFSIGRM